MSNEKSQSGAPSEKPESNTAAEPAKPIELSVLAALLNPEACRAGDCRETLVQAALLFEESKALCREWARMPKADVLNILRKDPLNLVSCRLAQLLDRPESEATLTLLKDAKKSDELREYLEKQLNLEGKTRSRSWSRPRTVLDNLHYWVTDNVNKRNARTAEYSSLYFQTQLQSGGWEDAEDAWAQYLDRYAADKNGCVTVNAQDSGQSPRVVDRYIFPKKEIDAFIAWKRPIRRQKGGMTAIRAISYAEFFV